MNSRTSFVTQLCLAAILVAQPVIAASKSELESRKQNVSRLYNEFQKHSDQYENVTANQSVVQNKIDAIEKQIIELNEELKSLESIPRKNASIYKLLGEVANNIELKDNELKAQKQELINVENQGQNIFINVENSERRYKAANRSLNQLIDQTIESETVAEIDKFEQPVKVTEKASVNCSLETDNINSCKKRAVEEATQLIQESKQVVTSSSVVRDFELESDLVEKYSNNQLSNVKQVELDRKFNQESMSMNIVLEVSAMVSAQANDQLITKFKEKIGLSYAVYRFVEGQSLSFDQQINQAMETSQKQNETKPSIDIVLNTLFNQGMRLVNLETFEGSEQSAFAVLAEMSSINANHQKTKMLASMLDGGVNIKAKEYSISNKSAEGISLVTNYQSLLQRLMLPVSPWIAGYLNNTSLNTVAQQESNKLQQARKQAEEKLSSKEIRRLLDSAKYLIRKDKYFEPSSGNAYDKVSLVLKHSPSNSKAKNYMKWIFDDAVDDAIDLAEDGDFADARALLEGGLRKEAGDTRLLDALDKVGQIERQPKKKRRAIGGF